MSTKSMCRGNCTQEPPSCCCCLPPGALAAQNSGTSCHCCCMAHMDPDRLPGLLNNSMPASAGLLRCPRRRHIRQAQRPRLPLVGAPRAAKVTRVGLGRQPAAKLDGSLDPLRGARQAQPAQAGAQHALVAAAGRQAEVGDVPQRRAQHRAHQPFVEERVPRFPAPTPRHLSTGRGRGGRASCGQRSGRGDGCPHRQPASTSPPTHTNTYRQTHQAWPHLPWSATNRSSRPRLRSQRRPRSSLSSSSSPTHPAGAEGGAVPPIPAAQLVGAVPQQHHARRGAAALAAARGRRLGLLRGRGRLVRPLLLLPSPCRLALRRRHPAAAAAAAPPAAPPHAAAAARHPLAATAPPLPAPPATARPQC